MRRCTVEGATAPATVVEIGDAGLDGGRHTQQASGLHRTLLRSANRFVKRPELRTDADLTPAETVEWLVGGKSSGCHRVGHTVRDQGQPDDLTHTITSARFL